MNLNFRFNRSFAKLRSNLKCYVNHLFAYLTNEMVLKTIGSKTFEFIHNVYACEFFANWAPEMGRSTKISNIQQAGELASFLNSSNKRDMKREIVHFLSCWVSFSLIADSPAFFLLMIFAVIPSSAVNTITKWCFLQTNRFQVLLWDMILFSRFHFIFTLKRFSTHFHMQFMYFFSFLKCTVVLEMPNLKRYTEGKKWDFWYSFFPQFLKLSRNCFFFNEFFPECVQKLNVFFWFEFPILREKIVVPEILTFFLLCSNENFEMNIQRKQRSDSDERITII